MPKRARRAAAAPAAGPRLTVASEEMMARSRSDAMAHQYDTSLSSQSMNTSAWPVDAGAQAFRHFRIQQMNVNSSGNGHTLTCAGIELYGRANFERPLG